MLQIALVGAGYVAQNHIAAYRQVSGACLQAVICRNEARGRKLALDAGGGCRYYPTLGDALADGSIDVVDICTPTDLHERFVCEAAAAGCHILCEKPLTFTLDSFERMYHACRTQHVSLMTAQVLRWWPEFQVLGTLIRQGKLGAIHMIYEKRIFQHPCWSDWHRSPERSGGGLYDVAVHDLDFLYSLFGLPRQVYAVGWKSPTGCWNHIAATLTWPDGVRAVCEASMEMTGPFPFSVEFRGTGDNGTLSYALTAGVNLHDSTTSSSLLWYPAGAGQAQPLPVPQTDMFTAELQAFVTALETGSKIPVPLEETRDVIRMVLAIRQSLESGKLIAL